MTAKEINSRCESNFLHEHLPLIDENDEHQQNLLNLERKWATKDCWFKLLMTRWCRNIISNRNIPRIQEQRQDDENYEIIVRKFSDMTCANLQDTSRTQLEMCQERNMSSTSDGTMRLERTLRKDGNVTRLPKSKQTWQGRTVGTANNGIAAHATST